MGVLEQRQKQREQRLCVIHGVMRSATWIFVKDRKPKKEGSYCVINDKGDYNVFDYRPELGFDDWTVAWLEEHYA